MKFLALQSAKKDSTDFCNLYARVRHGEHNKKYAVGLKVLVSEWDKYQNGQFAPTDWMDSINISYAQFDSILTEIKNLLEGEFNPDTAISEIKNIREANMFSESMTKKSSTQKDMYFTSYMQTYVDTLKTGSRTKHKQTEQVSDSYIMLLEHTLRKVCLYEDEYGRLLFKHIDMAFRNNFMAWCAGKNISENSISSYLSSIRLIMKTAYAEHLTKSHIHLDPDFVPTLQQTENVFLTMDQIEAIYKLDLTTSEVADKIKEIHMRMFEKESVDKRHLTSMVKTLNRTRDIFVAGCLTGQRESDYMRFNKGMIVIMGKNKFLKVKQIKTKKTVFIPLDRRVEEILDKYDGKFPTVCTWYFNRYIHILCEIMGWTWIPKLDNTNKSIKAGNRFCDLVCSHTARRSFATNAYAAGVPLASIMAVTGHSREEHVRRYLKQSLEEKALLADKDMQGFVQKDNHTTTN